MGSHGPGQLLSPDVHFYSRGRVVTYPSLELGVPGSREKVRTPSSLPFVRLLSRN